MQIIPVILAGGSGTRLWPLSRSAYPKQFLSLLEPEQSLFQTTLKRVINHADIAAPIIVCNEEHRFIVAEQLRQLEINPMAILLESIAKNTAPAIALAAHYVKQHCDDAYLWVMPADHVIADPQVLVNTMLQLKPILLQHYLIAFGVPATRPETGYGYIEQGTALTNTVFNIARFIEKPSLEKAKTFCATKSPLEGQRVVTRSISSGDEAHTKTSSGVYESIHEQRVECATKSPLERQRVYFWNCGMFAFKASTYLDELTQHSPNIATTCGKAISHATVDSDFVRPSAREMTPCPADSIDYAVMEKSKHIAMTILNSHWSDIGSWQGLMSEQTADANENIIAGDVVAIDVSRSYLRTEHRLLAAVGVSNLIVVATDDAVLVADQQHSQHIKTLVEQLKLHQRPEVNLHLTVQRPWGHYHTIAEGINFKVKRIQVHPQHCLSLQLHRQRSEHWVVITGVASVTQAKQTFTLRTNESTFIPANTQHRLANKTNEPLIIIEVQVGDYLGEDDIERFADNYGRAEPSEKLSSEVEHECS